MRYKGIHINSKISIQTVHEKIVNWQIEAPHIEGYVIGRSDSDAQYAPDIDLTPFHVNQSGISRRHAALVAYRGYVHVVDLDSTNGTFINGERISPSYPYLLKDGDILSIANLDLVIAQVVN